MKITECPYIDRRCGSHAQCGDCAKLEYDELLTQVRHIFDACIDNASEPSAYVAWTSARDIFEYFLAGNFEALSQFDYLKTAEEEENESWGMDDCDYEIGYDPYMGCFSDDC